MDNIIKQGYLKKSRPTAPGSNPANSFLQLFEPTRWFVFGLRNRRPYLEYYEKEQHVFSAQPINSFDLFTCTKVTYTLGRNNRNWTFCLFLQDRILELTAESREVMLSWCRTLEHTLQNYGALKHVPSEHIYSDYPIKYKPKRSISPPPIDDRDLSTPTPPPSEPAPPIPDVIACGAAVRKPDISEYFNSEMVASEKQESENDEPDTSEDDFVDEGFFMQKKMEAHTSSTLKLDSRLNNPLAIQSRSASTLPSMTFMLPTDSESIPEVPVRPSRNKPKMSGSTDYQYSKVLKKKADPEADSEGVYEKVFDFVDHNTFVEQPEETDDGRYETAFDVKDTKLLVEKRKKKEITVELPKRKSQFVELEKISENKMSQNGLTENFYSDFHSVISPQIKDDYCVNTDFKRNKMSSADKVDIENNHKKKENLYDNFNACLNTNTDSSATVNGDNSHVALAFESSKNSPIKPPRSSKRASNNEDGYANLPVSKSDSKQLEGASCHLQENEAPPIVKSRDVKENIYDFGKCTDPTKNSDIIISKQSIKNDYENVNSSTENKNRSRKSKEVKRYSIPPPLNFDLVYKRSSSSSPDTSRRTPTNTDQISTKACLLDLPPSPTSPSTPVNDPNINFPPVHRSVINVSHKRQSTPSPKLRHSRQTSHSPKGRHSDVVAVYTQTISKLSSHNSDSSNKENSKPSGQERPSSLQMIQMYDVKTQPVRKNTGESLYSPVMNRNWFGSQPMPGVGSQPISVVDSQPVSKLEPNVDSSQPVIDSSIDTTYEVPKRARSVIQHEPQPTLFSRNLVSNGKSSSPSHDGFQFNVPSMPAVYNEEEDDDDDDDDDDEKHEYEDATMRHVEPPLPPRRNQPTVPFRSQSVYVPCNISQDPSRVIVRQTSLRERQRITSGPGLVTVLPLKQSEIDILQEEQQSHGIIVKITPAACQKIALVDCLNGVWVVGWDCKHYPRLAESIHIGDEVTKINDVRVTSAHMARKALKACNTDQVDFVIKRLPYAHVMAIRRHQNGQKLGLQRFGGTAEITYVDPAGLAAEHGLSKHAKCVETEGYCNWWITEINNRPLNLSFKGNEIECKLNAVGKDISIVVHPSDFVKELKKQLKRMRNFKDYLAI